MEVLKVSSKSSPNSCAGAMAGVIRQDGAVEVQVVGAGALNQAVKAVAIARGYLAAAGIDLVCVPTFADIEIDGASRTAIRLLIEDREHRMPNATLDLTHARPAIVREVRPDAPVSANGNGGGAAPADDGKAAAAQRELSSFLV